MTTTLAPDAALPDVVTVGIKDSRAIPVRTGSYRPTTLKLAARHCARAINFYAENRPTDRRIFAAGTSAHACLQAAQRMTDVRDEALSMEEFDRVSVAVCEGMIREGRLFEGDPEPPLPMDSVWRGRDLARSYFERYPIEPGGELLSQVESGLAVDERWRSVPYGPGARFRLIVDLLTITEEWDEESGWRVLAHRDYKSAWPTSASELETIQMKAQAVLTWIHHGSDEIDILESRVVNLRTGALFTRSLDMRGEGPEIIERWKSEITATMNALDSGRAADGLYAASPGGGCIGCPYVAVCAAGKEWSEGSLDYESPEQRAIAYWTTKARLRELEVVLREESADEPVPVGDGLVVGTVAQSGRKPAGDAWQVMLEEWTRRGGDIQALMLTLGVGVKQITNVAAVLFPEREDREERDEWVESLMESYTRRSFGFHEKTLTPEVVASWVAQHPEDAAVWLETAGVEP